MKKKISLISIFIILFLLLFSRQCFAKYVIINTSNLEVYIDKTPPTINLKSDNINESYSKTDLENVIQDSNNVIVITNDNVKIDYNEYYYNVTTKDFTNIEAIKFDSGKEFSDEGYYKIVAVDTSGNKTEIVMLIDKSAPEVKVQYFKKGEEIAKVEVSHVAAQKEYFATENIANTLETNETEEIETTTQTIQTSGVALMSARASTNVYSESDFINAINNKASDIIVWTSINISQTVNINYNVTIHPATNENALRYNGYGNFFNVQSGGTLNITAMVVDTNSLSKNRGTTAINVQSGGKVVFRENSIVDGGANNKGIVVNSGGTALIYSCHIANCTKGIIVKGNGNLTFGNLGDGRNSEFWSNTTAISFESFTGTSNFNQSNIKIYNNTNGVVVESSTGTVNVSAGYYYSNGSNGIISKAGTFNLKGGNVYSNGNGVNFCAGTMNFSGGNIYNNKVGVLINPSYTGKFNMTGGKIYSNSSYAINHGQNSDGSCTITGGTVTGVIYLAQSDNYVNTNSSYPSFTVTPSSYYFKRKLVKTTSNDYANNEISKVTMTPNGSWYKYVEDEYIKVWKGCNVIVKCTDYYGNVLSTETITGNLGESYTTTSKELDGYDLITSPSNASGTYTENDITVEYKYDLVNVAKVTFEDLLSGVKSAKYWYNESSEEFTGDGTEFENNKIFEEYGYYKVIVENNVGLTKELIFSLNKESLVR
ncbi:MAG: MucBP domain-containing protein [Clostridia bacterium]|nr:MucBP domain-containing protein [Clostridia bacterium]